MKVVRKQLLEALKRIAVVVPQKSPLPILECVHIQSSPKNNLRLTGFDLVTGYKTNISAGFESVEDESVSIAVPIKLFGNTIAKITEPDIYLHVSDTGGGRMDMIIQAGTGTYTINGYNGNDYPVQDKEEDSYSNINIDFSTFKGVINSTRFCLSTDEFKLAMTGLYVSYANNVIKFAGTNAHQLAWCNHYANGGDAVTFIAQPKALDILNKIDYDGDVEIHHSPKRTFFTVGADLVFAQNIEAQYPNYEPLIPQSSAYEVAVNRAALLASIKRLGIFANSTTHLGKFEFTATNIHISSGDEANKANEVVEAAISGVTGDAFKIGMNLNFLEGILGAMTEETVFIRMDSPSRAVMILGEGDLQDSGTKYIVMPIMLTETFM